MRLNSLTILISAAALILCGCAKKEEASRLEPPAVPVKAAAPTVKEITVFLESIGTLKPSIFVEVRPQIDGTLTEVLASEGQWVVPGTPLFKIDSKPYALRAQEVEAQLAMDRANLQAAKKKLARIRPLAEKELIAQTEKEDLEAEADRTIAAVALNEARLNSAKLDLERCMICSPTTGRIGKLDVHPGNLISRGQSESLASISQIDPLRVEFTLTEKEFQKVAKDRMKIEMRPLCNAEICKEGEITFLDTHYDPSSGLILVRGKIANPDHSLRPGQTVQVRIPVSVVSNAKLIPQKAIRYNQEGPYIYVVQPDQTVAMRQLILGEEQGIEQVVLEGIDPSEQLIIDGHLRISPGVKVDVKP